MICVSMAEYLDLCAHFEERANPTDFTWRNRRDAYHREWMKRAMRRGEWPWSKGPKGRLP